MTTTPMTPDQWVRQLRKFKVPLLELPTFRDLKSGRDDETGLKFGPVSGCGIHHTGDDAPDYLDRNVIVKGRPDLPGPLAHAGLRDDGVVELVTVGRANHFGGGDPDVLKAVNAGKYIGYPPPTDKHQGESGAVDGNDVFYGLEVYYSGGKPMTLKQYDSAVGWAAAICDFHGWNSKHVIGHKEWSDYKIDPGNVDMRDFRQDVEQRLAGKQQFGPRRPDPKITKAIKVNIRYSKTVEALPFLPSFAKGEILKDLKVQRKKLRAELNKESTS
jgi:hypothetical protein